MTVCKENCEDLSILLRALDLPILRNDLHISGTLYISEGIEALANTYSCPLIRDTVSFEAGTGTYVIAKLSDDVEIVQPVAWEEKG